MLQVLLRFLLDKCQVTVSQRVRVEAACAVGGIIAHKRNALQLLGNASEAERFRLAALGAQCLKEKERFEVGVGGHQRQKRSAGGRWTATLRRTWRDGWRQDGRAC